MGHHTGERIAPALHVASGFLRAVEPVLRRVERDEVAMAFQEQPRLGARGINPRLVRDQSDPLAREQRVIIARQHIDPELDRSLRGRGAEQERAQPNDPFFVSRAVHRF